MGDEGGFAPDLPRNEDAVHGPARGDRGRRASRPGDEIAIALDPATSELWRDGAYVLDGRGPHAVDPPSWSTTGPDLVDRYPIVSIEDGMAEDDWDGWAAADRRRSAAGSSWSATTSSSPTPSILERGIHEGVANAILIKLNQIGTLTETLEAVALATAAATAA